MAGALQLHGLPLANVRVCVGVRVSGWAGGRVQFYVPVC